MSYGKCCTKECWLRCICAATCACARLCCLCFLRSLMGKRGAEKCICSFKCPETFYERCLGRNDDRTSEEEEEEEEEKEEEAEEEDNAAAGAESGGDGGADIGLVGAFKGKDGEQNSGKKAKKSQEGAESNEPGKPKSKQTGNTSKQKKRKKKRGAKEKTSTEERVLTKQEGKYAASEQSSVKLKELPSSSGVTLQFGEKGKESTTSKGKNKQVKQEADKQKKKKSDEKTEGGTETNKKQRRASL